MVEFTLFRIPVRIELSFWLTLALLGFLMNQREPADLLMNVSLFVFAGSLSIFIHEMGHGLMIKKYGLPTQIVLASFGGYATHPAGVLSRLQSFLVTLAGPLLQAVSGLLVLYLVTAFIDVPANKMKLLVEYFINISLFWAVLNCVPVLPLDGGRMLEAILGPKRIIFTLWISIITAGGLAIFGFMSGLLFMGIFMIMFAWQNYQAYDQYKR